MITGNTSELDEAIRSKILPYLYNGGEGKWIHCAHLACLRNRDRPKSKQFDEIKVKIVKLQVMSLKYCEVYKPPLERNLRYDMATYFS